VTSLRTSAWEATRFQDAAKSLSSTSSTLARSSQVLRKACAVRMSRNLTAVSCKSPRFVGTTSVSHGDQSFPQHSYNGKVQVHNCSALLLERFSNFLTKSKVYFLHLIVVPCILLDCNFIPQIRLLRFQIFHSNFTNGAHVM